MAKPRGNLRLFVAAYPPPELSRALIESLRPLRLPAHRCTPVEQVHLTLQFIGDTPEREMEWVRETVSKATGGLDAFELRPRRFITLPERGRARLVAAELDAPPTLLELQRRLAHRLATNPRDRQQYRPHMTVCRFTSPQQVSVEQPLEQAAFAVSRILLMRSTLRHDGAQHHEVASFPLQVQV